MTPQHWCSHSIDGRQVHVALRDGTRIDRCQLVSIGRRRSVDTLWLFASGEDLFVACVDVIDVLPADGRLPADRMMTARTNGGVQATHRHVATSGGRSVDVDAAIEGWSRAGALGD